MRTRWAGLALLLGCAGDLARPADKPATPAADDERDALWSLAPEGASVGVVVSPDGLGAIEHVAAALHSVLASSTAVAPLDGAFVRSLVAVGKTKLTLEQHGLDQRHGLAVFVTAERQRTWVLPVADRDKFLTAMRGTKRADGDELAGLVCKSVRDRYVCVERREAFAALSKRGLDDVRKHDPVRGDIEVALRSVPGLGGSAVAAAELTRGALTVRGSLHGVSPDIVQMLGAPSRPRAGAEGAAGFGVLSVAPMLAMAPATPLVPGATFASVGRAVSGPITYLIAGGTEDPAIRIPLRDVAPVKALVENCTKLPMLAVQGAAVRDGACRVPVGATTALDGWIDGSELRIANRVAASPSALAPTPLARELAQREWAVSIFGRGIYLDLRSVELHFPLLVTSEVALRLMPLINEARRRLLAAASTDRFRAVFAFGPVADPRHYGDGICIATDKTESTELAELEWTPRAPVRWIDTIVTPTLVIEGEHSGNAAAFPAMRRRASSAVQFLAVPGADHFDVLAPTSEMIARAILADTGPNLDITLDTAAIARAAAATH